MKVIRTKSELKMVLGNSRNPRSVLVPTMGAFHQGHLSLIERARKVVGECGVVVVSIFVNPIQFDREEDLVAYPKTLESDLTQCREMGVDVVFVPTACEMYPQGFSTKVSESSVSLPLCGGSRPGHFDGVCTVVLKLFLLTACRFAVFGEKDFQQLAVIRRMVRDLDVPVEIVVCETVRDADGLAMSSRNVRLSPVQRSDAANIHKFLKLAAKMTDAPEIRSAALRRNLEQSGLARVDYVELVDAESLRPLSENSTHAILAVAVYYGTVRLIDHISFDLQR